LWVRPAIRSVRRLCDLRVSPRCHASISRRHTGLSRRRQRDFSWRHHASISRRHTGLSRRRQREFSWRHHKGRRHRRFSWLHQSIPRRCQESLLRMGACLCQLRSDTSLHKAHARPKKWIREQAHGCKVLALNMQFSPSWPRQTKNMGFLCSLLHRNHVYVSQRLLSANYKKAQSPNRKNISGACVLSTPRSEHLRCLIDKRLSSPRNEPLWRCRGTGKRQPLLREEPRQTKVQKFCTWPRP